MGLNKWGEIQYNRVASVAMKLYRSKFLKHDKEGFRKFLADGRSRKFKPAAGAKPHEIIQSLKDGNRGQVTESQWKTMVDDLRKHGKFKNCTAVVGHSLGMRLDVSVALGLLISELREEPWKRKVITLGENLTLQMVEGKTLSEKDEFVKRNGCSGYEGIDFEKVFDVILEVAVNGKLKEEDMIKRLFVFSDEEFDQASASWSYRWYEHIHPHFGYVRKPQSSWETEYKAIARKFTEKGYGNAVPEFVFWNLRHSSSTPVAKVKKGVTVVSGFSTNFLKLFLNEDAYTDPIFVMEDAISRKEYQNLSVID